MRSLSDILLTVLVLILTAGNSISDDPTEEWVALYNGPGDSLDIANSIALDGVGNTYVTGRSCGSGTRYDYATIKYNNDGVEQWVARYNGPGNFDDIAQSIALDEVENIYVTGKSWNSGTYWDYTTIKYNNDGVEQWIASYNGPGNYEDSASSIALDGNGNVHVTGYCDYDYMHSYSDYATIKYSQDTGIVEAEGNTEFSLRVYPCPVSNTASVTVSLPEPSECSVLVYSLNGRLVETLFVGTIQGAEHTFVWQTSQIPVGVYLLRASTGSIDNVSLVAVIR